MVSSEFGRTPQINRNAGRDHWPSVAGALLTGGGLQCGQVLGSGIALVAGKAEIRVNLVPAQHFAISPLFGQNRCGADFRHFAIRPDHRLRRTRQPRRHEFAVDDALIRDYTQAFNGATHGQQGGLMDIQLIDFRGAGLRNAPGLRMRFDCRHQRGTTFLTQALGIIQTRGNLGENDRRCHHRPRQRPAPGFVYAAAQRASTASAAMSPLD